MITKRDFLSCKKCPAVIRKHLDQPWEFIGQVHEIQPYVRCKKCPEETEDVLEERPITTVDLSSYRFVSKEKRVATVYFGVCHKCDSVYWGISER